MTTDISITSTDIEALAALASAEAADVYSHYKTAGLSDADAAAMSYGVVIDVVGKVRQRDA